MQTWIILAVVDVCRKGIKALNLLQNSSSAALVVPIRIGKSILVVRKSYAALESARVSDQWSRTRTAVRTQWFLNVGCSAANT